MLYWKWWNVIRWNFTPFKIVVLIFSWYQWRWMYFLSSDLFLVYLVLLSTSSLCPSAPPQLFPLCVPLILPVIMCVCSWHVPRVYWLCFSGPCLIDGFFFFCCLSRRSCGDPLPFIPPEICPSDITNSWKSFALTATSNTALIDAV